MEVIFATNDFLCKVYAHLKFLFKYNIDQIPLTTNSIRKKLLYIPEHTKNCLSNIPHIIISSKIVLGKRVSPIVNNNYTQKIFQIDQQISQHFVQYSECLSKTPSLLCNLFLNSRISANHDKECRFQPIVKSSYSLMYLQCRISFNTHYLILLTLTQPLHL